MSEKTVYITRKAKFNAAHKLWNPNWDDKKNHEVFGKCANENWHGHNYELHVTVKGVTNPDTGFCMDLKILSNLIAEYVEEPLDHRNINLDVEWMKGKMASTENLIIEIWEQLVGPIAENDCTLHHLRLYETENNYADYFGGE
jgi:6-pyruvoyltetrahydropterin/6-carboxytetrahydropterin synthase